MPCRRTHRWVNEFPGRRSDPASSTGAADWATTRRRGVVRANLTFFDTSRSSPPLYKALNRPVRGTEQAAEAGVSGVFLVTPPERRPGRGVLAGLPCPPRPNAS